MPSTDARTPAQPRPPAPEAAAAVSSTGAGRELWRGVDHANVMSVELMVAVAMWTAIGWQIDRWLGTAPWFLATGAILGNFAGLYLVYLRGQRMLDAEASTTPEGPVRGR